MRCSNRVVLWAWDIPSCGVLVAANFGSLWWCDVLCCDVVWCHLVACEATFGRVIRCDVTWCDAGPCHVTWCDVMYNLMWCDGMYWRGMGWDVVGWCWIGRWCAVNYKEPVSQQNQWDAHSNAQCSLGMQDTRKLYMSQGTTMFYSGTTPDYKGLLQYHSLKQRTSPVPLPTTKSDSVLAITSTKHYTVLLYTSRYCKVPLCTTL